MISLNFKLNTFFILLMLALFISHSAEAFPIPGGLVEDANSAKGIGKAVEDAHTTYDAGEKAHDVGEMVSDHMKNSGCTTVRGAFMLAPLLNLVIFYVSLYCTW